jgi:hypothetical protein
MTIRCLLLSYICIVLYTKFSTAVQYGRRTTSTAARTYGRIIFKKKVLLPVIWTHTAVLIFILVLVTDIHTTKLQVQLYEST